jgi:hypothetical protein
MQFRADGVCSNCGVDQTTGEKKAMPPAAAQGAAGAPASFGPSGPLVWAIAGAAVLVVLVVIGVVALRRPRAGTGSVAAAAQTTTVVAAVASVRWHTVVHVDAWGQVPGDGFTPPADALHVTDAGTRVQRTDHVRVGSHQEPYTEQVACGQDCTTIPRTCTTTPRTCTSNKNGFATCTGGDQVCTGGGQSCSPRYCTQTRSRTVDDYSDIPRYHPYFTWTSWQWRHERDATLDGTDLAPKYADPHIQTAGDGGPGHPREREAGREMDASVTFAKDAQQWTYRASNEADLQRFAPSSQHTLHVGPAGTVETVD